MNRRVITSICSKKHKKWIGSIKDKDLRRDASKHTFIAGGAIASMLLGEKVSDFDIYCDNYGVAHALAEYYVKQFGDSRITVGGNTTATANEQARIRIVIPSDGVAKANRKKVQGDFAPIFLTDNAITLTDKVQLVIRFYGNPAQIHENYDFVHCMNYWHPRSGLVLHPGALESLLTKQLYYVGSKYPICSMIRLRKFIKRGFYINAGQMLKIAGQISELDLGDIAVLEEQLVGVDAAYFNELISKLKERRRKYASQGETYEVGMGYLAGLCDEVFG